MNTVSRKQESRPESAPKLEDMVRNGDRLEDIDPNKLTLTDLQSLATELQGEYRRLGESNMNPGVL